MRTHRWAHRPKPDVDVPVANPFATRAIAVRYASARPNLHHHVTPVLLERVPRPRRALDLGCGTGLSTSALRGFANTVVGVDVSEDMLATRTDHTALYVLATAERLPFVDGSFDLVTIASAIHWFEPEAIAEVARVVTTAGWLVIYDVWFRAEMAGVPEFEQWAQGEGLSRYRPVAKHEYDERTLALAGFERAWDLELRREVEMSQEALVEYLMTHSERISAIREGLETESEQRRLLREGIDPLLYGRAYTDGDVRHPDRGLSPAADGPQHGTAPGAHHVGAAPSRPAAKTQGLLSTWTRRARSARSGSKWAATTSGTT